MNSTLDMQLPQTALTDAGVQAEQTLALTLAMTVGSLLILFVVMLLVWLAWRTRAPAQEWWIVAGGIVVPLVVLSVLFVASTLVLRLIAGDPQQDDSPRIRITGHQYWWDIVHDPEGSALRDANEVVIPVGTEVVIELSSKDVIHSFWMPSIAGKMDMIPGRVNTLRVTATRTGRFRGQCAEFCGLSHPLMAFEVVVVSPEEYTAYLLNLENKAPDPVLPNPVRGRDLFESAGCVACHEIRGVAEGARSGPDLTRVGARGSLGAGMWRMNIGNLAGWIANVQHMKPGAKMPSYNHLPGPDLRAIAAYLEGLK